MSLIKDFFQGKWLGHPLHPALVHVPTGLFPAATVFDLVAVYGSDGGDAAAVRCAMWCVGVALVGAIVAAPTGLADWWDVKRGKPAHRLGVIHMVMNVAVLVLMAISLYLRWRQDDAANSPPALAVVLALMGNGVLLVSGYLGGRMVYDKGVGVGRMSKNTWREIARAGHARLPVE